MIFTFINQGKIFTKNNQFRTANFIFINSVKTLNLAMDDPVETSQINIVRSDAIRDGTPEPPTSPPSSYDSCMKSRNEVIAVKDEEDKSLPVTKLLCRIILSLAIINSVAIAAIILGAINIDECVQEPKIPIFLIVFGVLMICIFGLKTPSISKQLTVLFCSRGDIWYRAPFARQHAWMKDHKKCVCAVLLILTVLLLACFICLQVWVYTNYNGFYNVGSSKTYVVNCDKDLYLFAFWLIAAVYLSLTLLPLAMFLCVFTYLLLFQHYMSD